MTWTKRTAAGDPMSDIIGAHVGDLEVTDDRSLHIGLSLAGGTEIGRAGLMRRLGRRLKKVSRAIKTVTNPVTKPIGRAVDHIPIAKDVVKFTTQRANLLLTPERFLVGAARGLVTGGLKGAARGIKDEAAVTAREGRRFIQNPVVRYGTKGAALIFPPLTPVAAGVEAANQVIAAVKDKDPVKAALALTVVANTVVAAQGGDLDALRAVKTIKAVKDGAIPKELGKLVPKELGKVTEMGKNIASFAIPKGADKTKTLKAATSLLSMAHGAGSLSSTKAAQLVIKNTIAKAKTGDKNAEAAAKVLAAVNRMRKPGPTLKGKVVHGHGSYTKAARAAKGKAYSGAYLVDAKGNVVKGNFKAQ